MTAIHSTGAAKSRRTQWASQFLAAAELIRRGYVVAFTTGNNTPVADLMVGTRTGKQFWVDVKGLSGRTGWGVKPKPDHLNLFYLLVHLAPLAEIGTRTADHFFVLTQKEANDLEADYRRGHPTAKHTFPGFSYQDAMPHEDKWDKLPQAD